MRNNISLNWRITTGHQIQFNIKNLNIKLLCPALWRTHNVIELVQVEHKRRDVSLYAIQSESLCIVLWVIRQNRWIMKRFWDESCTQTFFYTLFHSVFFFSSPQSFSDKWLQSNELFYSPPFFKKRTGFCICKSIYETNHKLEFVNVPFSAFSESLFFCCCSISISI